MREGERGKETDRSNVKDTGRNSARNLNKTLRKIKIEVERNLRTERTGKELNQRVLLLVSS